jgi:acetyltransferase-like isoleucine patch superfamily enzyme
MLVDISKFKYIGKHVEIGEFVKIISPEKIEIDDYSRIDDFSILVGGSGIKIGKFVHISSYSSVIGGGELVMEDFSGLSAGCRIITGSDDYKGRCLTNPCTPLKYRSYAYKGKILIKKHAILGTNTIVHPNITIGEGVATGSATVVNKDLEPWTIYVGAPAKAIKERQRDIIPQLEKELMLELYGK